MTTESIVEALKQEKERIENAIAALEGSRGKSTKGRRTAAYGTGNGRRRKRTLSAAARRRISEAAKARWTKAKRAGRNSL